jgi:1,4-dihydroxy-2-naphthoate polyprenyltransferase
MSNSKNWIEALRLRTLPLSLSGIIVGSFIAYNNQFWNTSIFVLALITTILFQIVSNLANDLGDGLKGTDNSERIGPTRAVQSGAISSSQMKNAVIFTSILSLLAASVLIYIGTTNLGIEGVYFYFGLALLCVAAAILYTVGKKAYGYLGLGDVFVFLFFGFVSVMGVYTLFAKEIDWFNIFPSAGVGFLSAAVLNLNNMRDHENDKNSNKRTLVVKLGLKKAKIYHFNLIILSLMAFCTFFYLKNYPPLFYLSLLPFILLTLHLIKVAKTTNEKEFDPELKKVALSTFFISVLFMLISILKA